MPIIKQNIKGLDNLYRDIYLSVYKSRDTTYTIELLDSNNKPVIAYCELSLNKDIDKLGIINSIGWNYLEYRQDTAVYLLLCSMFNYYRGLGIFSAFMYKVKKNEKAVIKAIERLGMVSMFSANGYIYYFAEVL